MRTTRSISFVKRGIPLAEDAVEPTTTNGRRSAFRTADKGLIGFTSYFNSVP